jgi:plastocyanin
MKRLLSVVFVSLILIIAASGCSRVKIIPHDEAHMGATTFIQTTASVKAGQPVKFIVDAGGATHILVVGTNGLWVANNNAPATLNSAAGLVITPGQEKDIVFSQPGTYTVTCTIHQAMLLTVTVQ